MNNHVHSSRYLDFVLFARFDQMGRCYGMPMEEFMKRGWNWYQKVFHIEFKRPITLAERIIVRTWLECFAKSDVKVGFQILKKENLKAAAEGHFISTMVNLQTGRAEPIPDWIIQQYTQYTE